MSGLDQMLQQIGSTADRFLADKLSVTSGTGEFAEPGRFSFGGLVTLLSLGARDRARGVPASADVSTADPALLQAALSRLGGPVTAAEAEEALDLLRTGAFATDVASSLRVLLRLVRHLPRGLFEDALRLPDVPADVVGALRADFAGDLPTRARDLVADLRDGRRDRAVLPTTLRVLLHRALPRDIAETIRALIGPENRTVRLAVLIYARTHGVDIDEADLDAVHEAIDPDNPDLAPLLHRGLDRLEAQYQAAGALAILRRLAPRPASV
jgi:hypothetical protein